MKTMAEDNGEMRKQDRIVARMKLATNLVLKHDNSGIPYHQMTPVIAEIMRQIKEYDND